MKIAMGALGAGCIVVLVMSLVNRPPRQNLQAPATLICINPQCLQQTGMTLAQIRTLKRTWPTRDWEPSAYECPKCKQMTAYGTEICPKCHLAFLPFKARRAPSGGLECPGCRIDIKAYRQQGR